MDLQTIRWNLGKKEHLDCIKTTLLTIKTNYAKYSQQDLIHLTYEFILFKEFKKEQSKWSKKTSNMQDLQCIDTLINYFETEPDSRIRQLIFDLIFSDVFYNPNDLIYKSSFPATFVSYAISIQPKQTLDCLNKWVQVNLVTNEDLIMNSLFNNVINDHFLLQNDINLDGLMQANPLFLSTFFLITLSSFLKTNLDYKSLLVFNFLKVLSSCLKLEPQLLMLVYKHNVFSNALNPFPGIIYLVVLFPLEIFHDTSISQDEKAKIYEMIENLHLANLKQVQDFNTDEMKLAKRDEPVKILTLNQANHFEAFLTNYLKVHENNVNFVLFNDCLDRFFQMLQLCLLKQILQFNKIDIKNLFEKFAKLVNNELFELLF